jgi:hypothetical protein
MLARAFWSRCPTTTTRSPPPPLFLGSLPPAKLGGGRCGRDPAPNLWRCENGRSLRTNIFYTKTGLLQPSSWLKSVIIINHSHKGWNCVFLLHKSLPLCFSYTQFSLLVPVPGVLGATLGEYCRFDHKHWDLT